MGFSLTNNPFTKLITDRYTDGGAGINNLDFSNIAKDLGAASALYGVINPNDSSGLANFFGTGGQQQPVGYTGGIPNYTATRELAPNAFASTYTTPDGEVAPRRPGMAGRRYFTDTTFEQSTDEPFMGVTKEQIAAQNQAAIDDQALFESVLGNVETKRVATEAAEAAEAARVAEATKVAEAEAATAAEVASVFANIPVDGDYNTREVQQVMDGLSAGTITTLQAANYFGVDENVVLNFMATQGAATVDAAVTPAAVTPAAVTPAAVTPAAVTPDVVDTITAANAEELDTFGTVAGIKVQEDVDALKAGITAGKWDAGDVAEQFNLPEIDVLEELLRSGFYGYEDNAIADAAAGVGIEEEDLVVQLLRAGKTNFAEVAEYYKDHPVYGGVTAAQVEASFNNTKFAAGGSTSKMTGRPNPFDASMGLFPNSQPEGLPEEVTAQVAELVRNYSTPDKGNSFGVPQFQDNAEVMTYDYPYGVNAGFEESLAIVDKIVKLENTMAAGSDQQKEQAAMQIEELKKFGAVVNGIPQNSFKKFVEVQKLRNTQTPVKKAAGGLTSLPHNGYYLGGTTDGMADNVPATIDNMQPAALSDGEFVIPADVVSHLGNGNSDAGAKNLYSMMDRVRTDRTGNPNQGRQIDPNKYLA